VTGSWAGGDVIEVAIVEHHLELAGDEVEEFVAVRL
jgi:hypothetical protein